RFAIERHLRQAATTAVGQLRAVLDAVGSGICVSDENGKFVLVNEPLSELLGTPVTPGMSLLDVVERFADPDELHALVSAGHEETVPARELELSDGRVVRCYSAPVQGERYESIGRALVFTDVTAEHELQQQLVASERLRATGEMAAGIAHDFNNLLATILGRVEVLLGQSRDADTTENLEAIRRAARDGAATVTRMREYGRPVDVGEFRAVDLAQLCNEVVELTRPRWRDEAQRAGKTITAEVRAAPTALVRGDPPALREALVNLIFNAVDAMPTGGKLTFSVGPSSGGVAVEVADTGEGMPDAVARRAFEPFFTTKGARGSGLGLAMVRKVVLGHGGDIQLNSTQVNSTQGSGTRITLWFPAAVGLTEESAVEPESPTEVGRLGRIVLVDDEQDVLDTTAMLLRKEGHDVRAFRDPRAAVEFVVADKPDLVISDLGMPGLNGWDVTRLVKEAWPDVPVVLLTGWGRDITPTQQRERGVAAAVSKPAELDQLRRVIAIMLPTDEQTGSLKVLVVDDSSGFAAALALLLAQDGHVVDRATRVTDGFTCVQSKRYDLVLLDLNLPDRPSRELVDLLATQPARPGICVMSGSAPQAMRDLAPGADYYIEKANVPERLREIYRVARPLASAPPKV
ncbi:MAG: response regulator, partial [Chloroflexi bacterium]|nr:response regulator [Chloroflexota bacterium]